MFDYIERFLQPNPEALNPRVSEPLRLRAARSDTRTSSVAACPLNRQHPNAEGMRAAEAGVSEVIRTSAPESSRATGTRLGANGHVLQLPRTALEAHSDDQHCRVSICRGPTPHRSCEAIQESGERDGLDLEDVTRRRAEL